MFNFSKFFLEKMYFSGKISVDIFEKLNYFLMNRFKILNLGESVICTGFSKRALLPIDVRTIISYA